MPRRARAAMGGVVYHVLNRGCGRMKLFSRDRDYAAFEDVLAQAVQRESMRLLSYCLMPNHWHLALWPREDSELSRFMFWLTMTHTQRWRHARQLVGLGPLYQGRFKAFPVETDGHFLTMSRYVEQNALRAGLVRRAEDWRWCSLNVRLGHDATRRGVLHEWPVPQPHDWLDWVNLPQTDAEVEKMRNRVRTGRPFGEPAFERRAAAAMGLTLTPRPRGRPRRGNK